MKFEIKVFGYSILWIPSRKLFIVWNPSSIRGFVSYKDGKFGNNTMGL